MIGYVRRLLDELVFAPQADEARGELRAFLDPAASPIDVEAQELDVLGLRSYPVASDLAGGATVRHELSIGLAVTHGDQVEAIRLRDGIVSELVLRYRAAGPDLQAADPDETTGQYVTRTDWTVDYRPLLDDAREYATIVFVVDTELDG